MWFNRSDDNNIATRDRILLGYEKSSRKCLSYFRSRRINTVGETDDALYRSGHNAINGAISNSIDKKQTAVEVYAETIKFQPAYYYARSICPQNPNRVRESFRIKMKRARARTCTRVTSSWALPYVYWIRIFHRIFHNTSVCTEIWCLTTKIDA